MTTTSFSQPFGRLILINVLIALFLLIVGVSGFIFTYHQRFFPGIKINQINMMGLSPSQATQLLAQKLPALGNFQLNFQLDQKTIASSSSELSLHYQISEVVDRGYNLGRQGRIWQKISQVIQIFFWPVNLETNLAFESDQVNELIPVLASQFDLPGEEPSVKLSVSGYQDGLTVNPGKFSQNIDRSAFLETLDRLSLDIQACLKNSSQSSECQNRQFEIRVPVASFGTELNSEQVVEFKTRAQKFIGKKITLAHSEKTITISDQQLIALLKFPQEINQAELGQLVNNISKEIDRPPQNAELELNADQTKAIKFVPPRNGLTLDQTTTKDQIVRVIKTIDQQNISEFNANDQLSFEEKLALSTTAPGKTLAGSNSLGLVERIGLGESQYHHSAASRVFNVSLATSRVNNTLIKPGEEFSFNRALGEVTQATGFKQAYVIKEGKTVLGDGGGVCQVSTTVFRAALDAGFKITSRKAHAYRVSYYELNSKPGVDATVYSPSPDLRFVNDSPNYVLLHAEANPKTLEMKVEFYGTSDGRQTQIVDHRTWGYRPAPPPVFIPDPSLPTGKLKQIDWAVSGIQAEFTNLIKDKNGQVIREDKYYSNYAPWSAKYLRGV